MDELLDNRLPRIAKQMDCSLDQINDAVERLSKLDMSPGLQIGPDRNMPVTADVIIEQLDEPDQFAVRLADSGLPRLRVSDYYATMAKDTRASDKTRKFLKNNIRSARWIMEAIEQRKNTLLKVTRSVVNHQKEFFEKGQLYLRPLPMSKVADDVGVHLATVSRAVARPDSQEIGRGRHQEPGPPHRRQVSQAPEHPRRQIQKEILISPSQTGAQFLFAPAKMTNI
jgi:RNA polymerase sigma-54 factor